ncbi:hypothetical protein VU01_11593 [Candidatus Electrothrix marina]|uniref:Uncharacterized protein n=1 Tax=Candidatus Electrothrix marina TaxID=1859130 RepID=A0A444JE86_9BACT|nr:hypothetical protein VU01_11593 [Candidatus Electrothrix marina]
MPAYKQKLIILQRGDDSQPGTVRFIRFFGTLESLPKKLSSSQCRTAQKLHAFERSIKIIEELYEDA